MRECSRSAPTDIRSVIQLTGNTQVFSLPSRRLVMMHGHTSDRFSPHELYRKYFRKDKQSERAPQQSRWRSSRIGSQSLTHSQTPESLSSASTITSAATCFSPDGDVIGPQISRIQLREAITTPELQQLPDDTREHKEHLRKKVDILIPTADKYTISGQRTSCKTRTHRKVVGYKLPVYKYDPKFDPDFNSRNNVTNKSNKIFNPDLIVNNDTVKKNNRRESSVSSVRLTNTNAKRINSFIKKTSSSSQDQLLATVLGIGSKIPIHPSNDHNNNKTHGNNNTKDNQNTSSSKALKHQQERSKDGEEQSSAKVYTYPDPLKKADTLYTQRIVQLASLEADTINDEKFIKDRRTTRLMSFPKNNDLMNIARIKAK